MAESPSMVSGRVVATMIFSSRCVLEGKGTTKGWRTGALYRVRKRCDDSELEFLLWIITRDVEQGSSL